jgi:3-hydroxyisobutyrate dehydrogenase-like beta-hydroxyacid dehydrogenase
MTTIGLVGSGYMGSGLGATLRRNGHEVLTSTAGRSSRTVELVARAGIPTVPDLASLAGLCEVLLVVTPPAAALSAAHDIASVARPGTLVVDLNAVSPSTMELIAEATTGLDLVDGSISGGPPMTGSDTLIYLSGSRAAEIAGLTWSPATPIVVGGTVGAASAVKMCTGSVFKGLKGLLAQALRTAHHHGVLDVVLADLARIEPEPHTEVALAVTKADRFVREMHEIATTQEGAGLTPELFRAFAEIYAGLAKTPLARERPETLPRDLTPTEVLDRMSPT